MSRTSSARRPRGGGVGEGQRPGSPAWHPAPAAGSRRGAGACHKCNARRCGDVLTLRRAAPGGRNGLTKGCLHQLEGSGKYSLARRLQRSTGRAGREVREARVIQGKTSAKGAGGRLGSAGGAGRGRLPRGGLGGLSTREALQREKAAAEQVDLAPRCPSTYQNVSLQARVPSPLGRRGPITDNYRPRKVLTWAPNGSTDIPKGWRHHKVGADAGQICCDGTPGRRGDPPFGRRGSVLGAGAPRVASAKVTHKSDTVVHDNTDLPCLNDAVTSDSNEYPARGRVSGVLSATLPLLAQDP
eukprot:45547-Prorocentrum_minimum.AAC.2